MYWRLYLLALEGSMIQGWIVQLQAWPSQARQRKRNRRARSPSSDSKKSSQCEGKEDAKTNFPKGKGLSGKKITQASLFLKIQERNDNAQIPCWVIGTTWMHTFEDKERSANGETCVCVFVHGGKTRLPEEPLHSGQKLKYWDLFRRTTDLRRRHSSSESGRAKRPSLGIIQGGSKSERNSNAAMFDDITQEWTEHCEEQSRLGAWKLAKHVTRSVELMWRKWIRSKNKKNNTGAISRANSAHENREFVPIQAHLLDMMSKIDLTLEEQDAITVSRDASTIITANVTLRTIEQSIVYVKELEMLVTFHLLKDSPVVLLVENYVGRNEWWKKIPKPSGNEKPHHPEPLPSRPPLPARPLWRKAQIICSCFEGHHLQYVQTHKKSKELHAEKNRKIEEAEYLMPQNWGIQLRQIIRFSMMRTSALTIIRIHESLWKTWFGNATSHPTPVWNTWNRKSGLTWHSRFRGVKRHSADRKFFLEQKQKSDVIQSPWKTNKASSTRRQNPPKYLHRICVKCGRRLDWWSTCGRWKKWEKIMLRMSTWKEHVERTENYNFKDGDRVVFPCLKKISKHRASNRIRSNSILVEDDRGDLPGDEDEYAGRVKQERDAIEAKRDVLSVCGSFICRYHWNTCMDFVQHAWTNLDVLQESKIDDQRNVEGEAQLCEPWNGFTRCAILNKTPPPGHNTWAEERLTNIQATFRHDDIWPKVWLNISKNAQQ